jgi:beta-lactamase class A
MTWGNSKPFIADRPFFQLLCGLGLASHEGERRGLAGALAVEVRDRAVLGLPDPPGPTLGLPAGVSVAHKTGSFSGVYHDAAIVEPPRGEPFVLVVLTRGIKDERRAHQLVAGIARAVYRHAEAVRAQPSRDRQGAVPPR